MVRASLRDVCVDVAVYNSRGRALKSELLRRTVGGEVEDVRDSSVTVVRALNHITLDFADGERVGIVGRNGAGKTSLMRVLGRIYPPTSGEAIIEGRVSSLLELTMGMDADATGFENIFMRATMLGLRKAEATAIVDDVVDFSELGEYLNLPVRTYSSGMLLRLAFAVSTAVNPEIAIFDEIIGVGDADFAVRARQRLDRMIAATKIMFLASHDNETIRKFCTRVIWMEKGQVHADGPAEDVLDAYEHGSPGAPRDG